jgi:hypothetical protein
MGNWTTVYVIDACAPHEVASLADEIYFDMNRRDDRYPFHCLCNTGGLCGLGNWAVTDIDRIGNLAERGYTVESVARQLEKIATHAPSLTLKVHCGGDYEDSKCVATITLVAGKATVGPLEVEDVGKIPEEQMNANFFKQLRPVLAGLSR